MDFNEYYGYNISHREKVRSEMRDIVSQTYYKNNLNEDSFNRHFGFSKYRIVEYKNEILPLFVLAKKYGFSTMLVWQRVAVYGWSVEKALSTPKRTYTKRPPC